MAPKLGFFKPKATATSDLATLELVVVAVTEDEGFGPASALAKRLGLKDMRATGEDVTKSVLGVAKSDGELPAARLTEASLAQELSLAATLASISPNHATKVLVAVSEKLEDPEGHLQTLESGGVKVERLSFAPGAGAAEARYIHQSLRSRNASGNDPCTPAARLWQKQRLRRSSRVRRPKHQLLQSKILRRAPSASSSKKMAAILACGIRMCVQ